MRPRPNSSAFTLVELSIVLVILGLLVGGVLAGQSLIRSAELRAITKEHEQYTVAINAFRDKYFAYPGDLANAYAFWGATCGTNATTASTGCNGDGNGIVNAATIGENLKAWEHLSRAGLIEGNFDGTGVEVSPPWLQLTSTNVPLSRFPQGGWNLTDNAGNAMGSFSTGQMWLSYGFPSPAASDNMSTLPSMTLGEAWMVDTKADDGRANTGSLRGDGGGDCYDNGTDYYALASAGASTTGQCILWFMLK